MAHVRFRNRETPKNEIECPIGGTVDPKTVCLKCAFATAKNPRYLGCSSYEDWLDDDQYEPDLEAETPILDTHKDVHQNGECKWCLFCIGIRLKRKLQHQYLQYKVWLDNHKLRYWCYE